MASNYPSSLPVKDAAGANLDSNPHSALHDDMYDDIVAIATELGTNPKGTAASVKARLDLINVGAYTDFPTVVLSQGSPVSGTLGYCKYSRVGRQVTFSFYITATAAGSGNPIVVTLPVTAAVQQGVTGSGYFYTAGTGLYTPGVWAGASTTTVTFVDGGIGLRDDAIASNDVMIGTIVYEAAS